MGTLWWWILTSLARADAASSEKNINTTIESQYGDHCAEDLSESEVVRFSKRKKT